MHLTSMNRYQAFAIHFGISMMIFLLVLAIMFGYWYPGMLREVDQGWQQALLMVVGVDLVLGPLLTLIVFNPTKKSLKMDLSIIGGLQIAALIAGLYTVHLSRPVGMYMAFPMEGFKILYANRVTADTLEYITDSEPSLFYYQPPSGHLPFAPDSTQTITPEQLSPINDGGYQAFVERLAPIDTFVTDEMIRIPVTDKLWLISDHDGSNARIALDQKKAGK